MSVHSEDGVLSTAGSFWERSQYKRTVQRIDDANRLCSELMTIIQERSELEKSYAKSLKAWSKKWDDALQKGPEYGTILSGWRGFFSEAEAVADLHQEMRHSLMTEVFPQIKQWQKENFHKSLGKIKESKEMDDSFRKAQKPWKQRLEKVEKGMKEYYSACKNERSAQTQQNNAKADTSLSPDQVKKFSDRVDKCERDKIACRDRYNAALADINSYNPKYMEDMTEVYNKCQDFEEKRLKFFKDSMFAIHRCLDLSSNISFSRVYSNLHSTISSADYVQDLRWWSQHHGVNMPMHWPEFEEWSPDMRPISGKRGTGHVDVDGVTLKRRTVHSEVRPSTAFAVPPDLRQQEVPESASSTNTVGEPGNVNPFEETEEEEDDDFFKDDGKPGVPVVANYDYEGVEDDEITFKAGDRFEKLQEEDEQGWCKARYDGKVGLYPASYARELRQDEL